MRAVVIGVALVACGSPASAPTTTSSPLPDAGQIVAATLATYRGLTSYEDRGVIATSRGQRIAFHTQIVKPAMRFDVGDLAMYSTGDRVMVESKHAPGRVDELPDLARVLSASASLSHGASLLAPSLVTLGDSHVLVATMRVAGTDAIAGHPCWQLASDAVSVWIDRDSHLIRRAAFAVTGSTTRDVIDYEPRIGTLTAVTPIATAGKTVVENGPPSWIGIRFDGSTTRALDVLATGPAERAGMKPGDEIVSIDGTAMTKSSDVTDRVRHAPRTKSLQLHVKRGTTFVDIAVTPERMPQLDQLASSVLLGKPAPDFAVSTIPAGGTARLADYSAGVVVLDFWATWCKPCEMMIPHLHALQTKYGGKLGILAISSETRDEIVEYTTAHALRYPVAQDADGKVSGAYLAQVLPTTIVVARGVVRFVGTGVGDEIDLDAAIARAIASP